MRARTPRGRGSSSTAEHEGTPGSSSQTPAPAPCGRRSSAQELCLAVWADADDRRSALDQARGDDRHEPRVAEVRRGRTGRGQAFLGAAKTAACRSWEPSSGEGKSRGARTRPVIGSLEPTTEVSKMGKQHEGPRVRDISSRAVRRRTPRGTGRARHPRRSRTPAQRTPRGTGRSAPPLTMTRHPRTPRVRAGIPPARSEDPRTPEGHGHKIPRSEGGRRGAREASPLNSQTPALRVDSGARPVRAPVRRLR